MNGDEYIEKIDFDYIIHTIHNFPLSTEFFYWLAQDDVENKIILEKIEGGVYERIGEYYIHKLRVFDGGGKFYLDKISESMNLRFSTEKELFYALLPELRQLEKKTVSEHLNGCYFTVVSDFYYKGKACGSCWEIYDLPKIIHIYKIKKAPAKPLHV
ncbi:MAG: hypothetical protein JSS10_08190 [Verrucomicrobia bacterium]|nr:hypothetical protein [Verrucomicrobiota bacterium]